MTQVSTLVKLVQIIARIEYKHNAKAVVYIVRSSNGKDQYRTTIYNGKFASCTCPAHGKCYHGTQCQEKEAARKYDVIGAALAVANQTTADIQVADFYEQRAKDIDRNNYNNVALALGWE